MQDACGDLTMTWRCKLRRGSSTSISEMVERLNVAIEREGFVIDDAVVEDDDLATRELHARRFSACEWTL
jgi:hypothetical protein